MQGIPEVTIAFPGIYELGEGCRIASTVTVYGAEAAGSDHGVVCADRVRIYDYCRLVIGDPNQHPDTGLFFGNDVIVNTFCYLSGEGGLTIGDGVLIGAHAQILSAGHCVDDNDTAIWKNPLNYGAVHIDAGAWIGAGATLLPGVRIGAGAVIGAGSVVTSPVEAHAIVAGNPAKFIRWRQGFEPPDSAKKKRCWARWFR